MDLADDGKLYYAVPVDGTDWDTRAPVRCDPDGSNRQTTYSSGGSTINHYHISVIEGSVVFNREDQGQSTVVVISADGSRVTTLDSCDSWSLDQVEDTWVYYLKGGQLRRCSMSGGSATGYATLGSATLWRVWNGRLLTFAKEGDNRVSVSNLDGSAEQVIYPAADGYTIENAFPVDDQGFVVWVRGGGNDAAVNVNPARKISRVLWHEAGVERMCSYADGVIITAKLSGNTYRVFSVTYDADPGGLDMMVPLSGEVRYTTHMDDDRIYFGVLDMGRRNHCSLHSVGMSGTGISDIAG